MVMNVDELLARWPTDIPFKGELISDDGCMCAQGQVLHYIGGMTPNELRAIKQTEADKKTAELLGISHAHAVLLRRVNDSVPDAPTCVLTEPEKVLGDQAQRVLAFWRHLDAMKADDWKKVYAADAAWDAAWDAACDAAGDAAWDAADAAWAAALDAARDAAGAAALDAARDAARATNEIQGAEVMRSKSQPFFFLPMFGFNSPEDIPLN